MKFGMMTQIQMPQPWSATSEREAFWHGLEQGVAAEAAGFEYIWITEQHFFIEIGHSSAPDMFLAALSQRTTTLRLGLGVVLLPIHNPFYVAERVASLDVLSNGRVEFGTGRGTSTYVVEGLGFDPTDGRAVSREALEAIMSMYENAKFPGYEGEHFKLPPRHVVPRPIQQPHPPLWVAATNVETYEHAGRQGLGVIGATRNTPEDTKVAIDRYRQAIRQTDETALVGKRRNEQVGAFGITACDKDDRVGRDIACAAARWYYGDNNAQLNPIRFTSAGGIEKIKQGLASLSNDDLIEKSMAIGGNADTICRIVERWAEAGLDQMIFMIQAGNTTHDQVMRSIDLIGEEVIPRFQDEGEKAGASAVR